jgi:hypothetical protein
MSLRPAASLGAPCLTPWPPCACWRCDSSPVKIFGRVARALRVVGFRIRLGPLAVSNSREREREVIVVRFRVFCTMVSIYLAL